VQWHRPCDVTLGANSPFITSVTAPPRALPQRPQAIPALAVALVASILIVYSDGLGGPFVFDDVPAILQNESIRSRWPLWAVLLPPAGTTVSGRPVLNLTLSLNEALGGYAAWGYHAVNVIIHAAAALTLFGIVRRTLLSDALKKRFGRDASLVAFAVALLWSVHPLQTEAVTYVIQRAESLMGFFYLLTFYCFIRSVQSPRPLRWQAAGVVACLLGMGTKEVMATAPVLVLLYDRVFCAGSLAEAWRRRKRFYLALAATWVPLALLVAGSGGTRQGSAGFTGAVSPASYWLTQFEGVARYLRLCFWPTGQVFDYGPYVVRGFGDVAGVAIGIVILAVLAALALWKRPPLGFLGAVFWAILAPTIIVPIATETIAEHRMYLPLAAVTCLAAAGAYALAGRRSLALLGVLACGLGVLTFERNKAYASEEDLWSDTVAKRPDNARAHCSLGQALAALPGRSQEAIAQFEEALRLHPNYEEAQTDLASFLEGDPARLNEAVARFEKAAQLRPDVAEVRNNLGLALAHSGRASEAAREYVAALHIRPAFFEAHANLGEVLCGQGDLAGGIREFEAALRIMPSYARAQFFLGNALVQSGRIPEAIQRYGDALQEEPDFAEASNNLGMILCRIGRTEEGMGRIDAAIRMRPALIEPHFARAAALMQLGQVGEAQAEYEQVLSLRPHDPSALRMLELIRTAH
jgi:tetratricopeptide (TPR) repeat protein